MPVPIDEVSVRQIGSALVAGVEEINRLSKLVDDMQARISELEQMDADIATYVETIVCSRSGYFTGQPPYVGWRGVGFALQQDYDELDVLRAQVNEMLDKWPSREKPEADPPSDIMDAGKWIEPLEGATEPAEVILMKSVDNKTDIDPSDLAEISQPASDLWVENASLSKNE